MLAMGNGDCREIRLLNLPALFDSDYGQESTHITIMNELKEMWPGWDIEGYYLVRELN